MARKEKIKPDQQDWRMTRGERVRYYIGDTGRQFCMSLFTMFVGIFLLFQSIDVTSWKRPASERASSFMTRLCTVSSKATTRSISLL